jgi:hypothetical protein
MSLINVLYFVFKYLIPEIGPSDGPLRGMGQCSNLSENCFNYFD